MGFGFLSINPSSIDFGTIIDTATLDTAVGMSNSGDVELTINSIDSDSLSFLVMSPSVPITIQPGVTENLVIRFDPTGVGTFTGQITVGHDGVNTPNAVPVSGVAVAVGAGGTLSVDPSAYQFPDTKEGTDSAEVMFTVTNTGDGNVDLTAAVVAAGWTLSTDPTPVTLLPTQTAVFGVKFSPVDSIFYYDAAALSIANTSAVDPLLVALSGLGVPIVPAYTVTGLVEKVLVGMVDTSGATVVNSLNPDIACEEVCSAGKQFDFWFPEADFPIRGFEKSVLRLSIYYEDYGNFTLLAQLTSPRGIMSNQIISVVGTSDKKTKLLVFDLKLTDAIQDLTLNVTAGIGSIVLILFSLQPGAEMVKQP